MASLNQPRIYELGARLHALLNNRAQAAAELFVPLTDAQKLLDGLLKGEPFSPVLSRDDAGQLLGAISTLFDKYFIDATTRHLRMPNAEIYIDPQELMLLNTYVARFDQTFTADLARLTSYQAAQRGIFSTTDLVENASAALPASLLHLVPTSAQQEINQAGRALGFGLSTAAAVHLIRAVEIMVARYYETYAGAPMGTRAERNLAAYLRKLQAMAEEGHRNSPDSRTVSLLVQIKERYRNPLLNPETSITIDDATLLFGIATGAIAEMANALQAQPAMAASGEPHPLERELAEEMAEASDDEVYDFRSRARS